MRRSGYSLATPWRKSMRAARFRKIRSPTASLPWVSDFQRFKEAGFADWRLAVDGLVARPVSFSLAELKSFPSSSQITMIACEEGWSYRDRRMERRPAGFTSSTSWALSPRLAMLSTVPFSSGWWDSILDMADALHPQTLLALGMNGGELPVPFGGPIRLRVPRQLGYKNVKSITRLTLADNLKRFGKGLGSSAPPEVGYAWYAGI